MQQLKAGAGAEGGAGAAGTLEAEAVEEVWILSQVDTSLLQLWFPGPVT